MNAAGLGGLLPTVDWLGGVPLLDENGRFPSKAATGLWASAVDDSDGSRPILWVVYGTQSLPVRRADRVIVGVELVPLPVRCGAVEGSNACGFPLAGERDGDDGRLAFWCRAWVDGADDSDWISAGEVVRWVLTVANELALPDSVETYVVPTV